MNKNIEKKFVLGGSIEKALSGDYELSVFAVLKEAWQMTLRHFLSFTPAIVGLLAVQACIFFIALKMQIGGSLAALLNPENLDTSVIEAIFIANFSYEVISAPIYAGVCLMGMSHAAGLKTMSAHVLKGLQFTIPLIIATLFSMMLQGIAGMVIPFLSVYLSLAFSNSVLLICEKRVPPLQSLLLSLRAVNKKLFPLIGLYTIIMFLFVVAAAFYGIFLIFVLPLFFHVKGIIYRNMFGITLKITAKESDDDSTDGTSSEKSGESDIFNA